MHDIACFCLNMPMLAAERRQAILERLRADGKVVAAELSVALAVSPDTIRRDLKELTEAGLVQRVHGGALPPVAGARPYAERERQSPSAKAAIATAVADLFRDDQVIILDAGTTTLEVARRLPPDLRATIITNSPAIALELVDHPHADVAVLGGTLDKHAHAVVGAAAIDALRLVRADVLVLGVCSLHPEIGITVLELEESYVKRAMIASSAEVVAVASSEKLGSAGPYVVAPIGELTHIVTDSSATDAALSPYRELGVEVVIAR
jgi:DeoR/GlpR family transcriptional regulator of sugar metabolism